MINELDQAGLQKLADELHATVEQTKSDILALVEELRRINSAIYAVRIAR